MVTEIWAKNYRSLGDVNVKLEPITVLVGHNGSGKSNFVDVARFIGDSVRLGLDTAVAKRGMSNLRRRSTKGRPYDVEVGIKISLPNKSEATYSFTLGSERQGEFRVKKEKCIIKKATEDKTFTYETKNKSWIHKPDSIAPQIQDRNLVLPLLSAYPPYSALFQFLTNFSFYNRFSASISEPQKPTTPYPLDENGSNLASTLRELERHKSTSFEKLQDAVKWVVSGVIGFDVRHVGGYLVVNLRHDIKDRSVVGSVANFDLSQESDGTLRLVGLLTALYQDPPRTLLVIEEPELGIHPGVLSSLWEEIEVASKQSQLLLTTHSPDLLDMCTENQLRVVEKVGGVTYIDELEEAQKQILRKKLFVPGELLRMNELRRRKQTEISGL